MLCQERYSSYVKLKKELRYLSDRKEYLEEKENRAKSYRYVTRKRCIQIDLIIISLYG